MSGSENLTAALSVVMRLDAAQQLKLRQILSVAPELAESAQYIRDAPPILKATIGDMRSALIQDLSAQWDMGAEEVSEIVDALTPVPSSPVVDSQTLEAYLAHWRTPMTGLKAAEHRLKEHYSLGWTPALISEYIKKFHHVTVSEASLTLEDAAVKIKPQATDVVIQMLSQVGPFNPDFATTFSSDDIWRVLRQLGVTALSARDMRRVGAQALSEAIATTSMKKLLNTIAVSETSKLSELEKFRPRLSQVSDFLMRAEVQKNLVALAARLEKFYGVDRPAAVDKSLFGLGYRGRPLRHIIPFTGQAEDALFSLREVLLTARAAGGAASRLPPAEQQEIAILQSKINDALQFNDELGRGAQTLRPADLD